MPVRPIEWIPDNPPGLCPGRARMIDQTLLPGEVVYLEVASVEAMHEAIRVLRVRGAPAIGVAAAMGVVIGAQQAASKGPAAVAAAALSAADRLATSRPTAVNLFKMLDRMRAAARKWAAAGAEDICERLCAEAEEIRREDARMCRDIGRHGAGLLRDGDTVLTHCNAGSLATSEYGTALGAIYMAKEQGKTIRVFADETRPLLQGARLTAWELMGDGIDTTLICDNMAAQVMKSGKVNAVLVGADRIAANGDTANKIGTYGVALIARAHRVPFYVLAPTSTFDLDLPDGSGIPIEQRSAAEVTAGFGRRTAPEGVKVYNPAFDVTPAELIAAIVCEKGVCRPDYRESLRACCGGAS